MIKLPYYSFFIATLFSCSTIYGQQEEEQQVVPEQGIEKQIIEGRDIELFDMILERIITSEKFKEKFQTDPPLAEGQFKAKWMKTLRDDIPLLHAILRQDLLTTIKEIELLPLENILEEGSVTVLDVDILLNTSWGGKIVEDESSPDKVRFIDEQTIEEYLIERAIRLVKEIEKISEDMQELKGAFEVLNEIVKEQGEEIDQIEENVKDAEQEIKRGVQHIEKAEEYQKNAYKIYYILLAILALITLLGILLFMRRRRK